MASSFKDIAIESNHAKKTLQLFYVVWWQDMINCFDLFWLCFQSILGQLVSEIFDFALHEETFSQVGSKTRFL